jgi:hypothetical protein
MPSDQPPSRFIFLFEHDLFGKPASTFPDHALAGRKKARPAYWSGFLSTILLLSQ